MPNRRLTSHHCCISCWSNLLNFYNSWLWIIVLLFLKLTNSAELWSLEDKTKTRQTCTDTYKKQWKKPKYGKRKEERSSLKTNRLHVSVFPIFSVGTATDRKVAGNGGEGREGLNADLTDGWELLQRGWERCWSRLWERSRTIRRAHDGETIAISEMRRAGNGERAWVEG
jgi:hypothetical protein